MICTEVLAVHSRVILELGEIRLRHRGRWIYEVLEKLLVSCLRPSMGEFFDALVRIMPNWRGDGEYRRCVQSDGLNLAVWFDWEVNKKSRPKKDGQCTIRARP